MQFKLQTKSNKQGLAICRKRRLCKLISDRSLCYNFRQLARLAELATHIDWLLLTNTGELVQQQLEEGDLHV